MSKDEIEQQIKVSNSVIAKNQRLARSYNKAIREAKAEKRLLERQLAKLLKTEQREIRRQKKEAADSGRRAILDTRVQCEGKISLYGRCRNIAPVGRTLCKKHDDQMIWQSIYHLDTRFPAFCRGRRYPLKRIHRNGLSPAEWIRQNPNAS